MVSFFEVFPLSSQLLIPGVATILLTLSACDGDSTNSSSNNFASVNTSHNLAPTIVASSTANVLEGKNLATTAAKIRSDDQAEFTMTTENVTGKLVLANRVIETKHKGGVLTDSQLKPCFTGPVAEHSPSQHFLLDQR